MMINTLKLVIALLVVVETLSFRLQMNSHRPFPSFQQHQTNIKQATKAVIASSFLFGLFSNNVLVSRAEDTAAISSSSSSIPVVPLYKNKGTDLIKYADVARGFSLLRPFGYNGNYMKGFYS